ncbi:MAG: hypothetical protein ACOC6B_04840, partial [Thermodesulfobacteriota bacterium]
MRKGKELNSDYAVITLCGLKRPPAEWLIQMNTFWKSKREEARARGDVWIRAGNREGVLRGRSFDTDGLALI